MDLAVIERAARAFGQDEIDDVHAGRWLEESKRYKKSGTPVGVPLCARDVRQSDRVRLLGGCFGRRLAVATVELLYATRGIDELTLASVEGVVRRVDLGGVRIAGHRRAGDEFGSVCELDGHVVVFGMQIFFHAGLLTGRRVGRIPPDGLIIVPETGIPVSQEIYELPEGCSRSFVQSCTGSGKG
jgi:hypothetical protein